MSITAEKVEQLLYEDESATLDFKSQQYPFDGASDDDKSELLKDILGFANAWRQSPAHILIGVEDVRGGRSIVVGTSTHLFDHTLQQFVNSRTNRPVHFSYSVCEVEGKSVGVIRISQQQRPIYLKKDYGKLRGERVYVRWGSSTDLGKWATPDEIAKMGETTAGVVSDVELKVEFAETKRDGLLGTQLLISTEFLDLPEAADIPAFEDRSREYGGLGSTLDRVYTIQGEPKANPNFYGDVGYYEYFKRLFVPTRLAIVNIGEVAASEVRIEITAEYRLGFGLMDISKKPDTPKRFVNPLDAINQNLGRMHLDELLVDDSRGNFQLTYDFGNIQAGRRVFCPEFFIGAGRSGIYEINGLVFASNLTKPLSFSISCDASVKVITMTPEELIAHADEYFPAGSDDDSEWDDDD